jgi:hypothetical protein
MEQNGSSWELPMPSSSNISASIIVSDALMVVTTAYMNPAVATPVYTGVTCGIIPVLGGWYTHFGRMDRCRLYDSGLWISIQNKKKEQKESKLVLKLKQH